MKKLFVLGFALCMLLPQAFGVVLFSSNGEDIGNFTVLSGEWSTAQGMIERVSVQEGGKTHGIVLDNVIDMTTVTFPVVLTYDLMAEKDAEGAGEVWTGIGLGAPAPGASNPEDGAIIVALRDNAGAKGLNFLVGGRQWAQGNANFDWQAGTWYTMRIVLSNPNFATNQVDITASVVEKGTDVGVVISGQGVPTGGNPYVLTQKALAIFSRGSAEGKGGIRSFDNIVVEAANVAGGAIAYQNDGTSVAEFTQVKGVFEVVDGAIVRTDAVAPDTTQGAMIGGVASMEGNASVSLEYDIKVETITTAGDETWSGIALFTPAPTASNIEDGAVIMTMRDGGMGSDQGRGLHALLGGRAWLSRLPNLMWKADTWYHMSITVSNADIATGKCDIVATLSEVGGYGVATLIMKDAPSTNRYELNQDGIALFSRSGGAAEGGQRSFDNIQVVTVPEVSSVKSFSTMK